MPLDGHYHYAHPHGRKCHCEPQGPVILALDDGRCDNIPPCDHCHPGTMAPSTKQGSRHE